MDKFSPKKQASIIASLRSQLLDIRLGQLSKDEWQRRVNQAVAQGVTVPKEWLSE